MTKPQYNQTLTLRGPLKLWRKVKKLTLGSGPGDSSETSTLTPVVRESAACEG